MRRINPELIEELDNPFDYVHPSKNIGQKINSYEDLVKIIARVSYINKDYLLFFRGQSRPYYNKAGSLSFYPSIYRGKVVLKQEIDKRFKLLETASSHLVNGLEKLGINNFREVKQKKFIQWSILQHYEVCPTPLLDLTHSIRVACSFALHLCKGDEPIVAMFALPYLTNRISRNSEHDIVNIRLLSICPPSAMRPYFQDGYLVGTDDTTVEYDDKSDLDFNNRLAACFNINNDPSFWGDGFSIIPYDLLFPHKDDIAEICKNIKKMI